MKNRLTPHPKKSECTLIYGGSFTGPLPSIYVGGNNLECVTHSRLLGVIIDQKLGWSIYIKELKKSFANKLSLMKKSRFLSKQDLLNLYFNVIIPAVTYGRRYYPTRRSRFTSKTTLQGSKSHFQFRLGSTISGSPQQG